MFIVIKDNNLIRKYTLEDHFLYKGIEIYFKNGSYYIYLKENYYFVDNTKSCLLELKKYEILVEGQYYYIELYAYELSNGIDDYSLYEKQKVLIACDEKANVVCKDFYLNDYYLYLADGIIQTNFNISVNDVSYNNQLLNDGDVIDYLGIRIIYYSDFLYINSFYIDVKLKEYTTKPCVIKYTNETNIRNHFILNEECDLIIDPLDKFIEPKKKNPVDFVKGIVPNIVMSLSTISLAVVSLYSSIINNQPKYTRLTYILMPIATVFTGILLPLIFYMFDARSYKKAYIKAKNEYLEYLAKYSDSLSKSINNYIDCNNSYFFDLEFNSEKIFYANEKHKEYMTLSLGKIIVNKDFEYSLTDDTDINNELLNIKNRLNRIENFPLFLSIKDKHYISVVTKKSDKYYFFNKFLLELASKHHYDDLHIGVYSDNDVVDSIYNLPHLFIGDRRLTLNSEKQLQELDQTKFDKPLVLFLYNHSDYVFTNPNIYVIYYSTDENVLYKNTNCVVKYLNNKAYLLAENKIEFNYVINSNNFSDYYSLLSKYRINKDSNTYMHLSDVLSTNIIENYKHQNNTLECSFAYSSGEMLGFDLHESKQGPHGLIGGCTGSGKSELIVSLLLSLCIRYSPDYLNIVLIDYKGGGIKESLSYKNRTLPHIVAAVSNLENNALERLIISLKNECNARQRLFTYFSRLTNTSIMNIDDYLDSNYERYNLNKLAHLVIVVDEFAQLKKENPEEIKELIAISRIGRSLGVHLILATQKPGGVIDDEIWSNAHFKIALKVFDESDSNEIIKKKDAAYLKQAGSFLLQVDDSLLLGQSIYSKNDINGNDTYKVSLLDNTLKPLKSYKQQRGQSFSEASVYCKNIIETCDALKFNIRNIDFLPTNSKYRKELTNSKCFVFGESDDYLNTRRSLVAYDLNDNVLIFSTRKNEVHSFLNTCNEFNKQCAIIGSSVYEGSYISDSLIYEDDEGIDYLLNHLLDNKGLNITLIIEDVSCLLSYDESYLDKLYKLANRSNNLNLNLLFFTSNIQISFKLINCFKNKVLININDNSDISAFYNMRSKYRGKSYHYDNEPITMIPIQIEEYVRSSSILQKIVKRIPEIIKANSIDEKILLGYDISSKNEVYSNNNLLVISLDEELLQYYSSSYDNIETTIYKYNMKVDQNRDILWLGPGIFNQRLFIASNSDDLNMDEGIYIRKGNKQTIKIINYV